MNEHLVIQHNDNASQGFLLFHGFGADMHDLSALGDVLAQVFPQSTVVSVQAPEDCEAGMGYQWFSLYRDRQGQLAAYLDDELRKERMAACLPAFAQTIRDVQTRFALTPQNTALVGFSQGAMMSLAASQLDEPLATRIIAIAGRFADVSKLTRPNATLHLIHGKADTVVPYVHTMQAAEALAPLDADFTADVIPFVEHTIDDEIVQTLMQRLTTHVPKRIWREAMKAAGQSPECE
jgi:phospholipase/carboxylesterase